jgi:uncharacterized membrane protein HdeD (DUF308 family)
MEEKKMPTGVAILKWYFIIKGILSVLSGLVIMMLFSLIAAAIATLLGSIESAGVSKALCSALFVTLGLFCVLWGVFTILIGVHLGRGRGWARTGALVVGTLSLLFNGGVLGILCLFMYLLSQECKAYFQT